jgi:hypothetical protein
MARLPLLLRKFLLEAEALQEAQCSPLGIGGMVRDGGRNRRMGEGGGALMVESCEEHREIV